MRLGSNPSRVLCYILARIGIWCNGKHGVVFAQPGEVRIFGPNK